jgi:hypothetical protein
MATGTVILDPPIAHNTFTSAQSCADLTEKWAQVIGTSGGHTVEIHGSIDGSTFAVLTGSGVAGTAQLPTTGSIAADGFFQIPHNVVSLKAKKTDNDDAAQVTIRVQGRVYK